MYTDKSLRAYSAYYKSLTVNTWFIYQSYTSKTSEDKNGHQINNNNYLANTASVIQDNEMNLKRN